MELGGERGALLSMVPPLRRWKDVAEFDEEVAELQQRQAELVARVQDLTDELARAQNADVEAMAEWVADPTTDRPCAADANQPRSPSTSG